MRDDIIQTEIHFLEDHGNRMGVSLWVDGKESYAYQSRIIFDSACCIMAFILLEYGRRKEEGGLIGNELLTYTEENFASGSGIIKLLPFGSKVKLNDCVELMIAKSDHIAANLVIDFLGLSKINETIRKHGFLHTCLKKKFLIPKVKNVGVTTPYEYARYYQGLLDGTFFGEEISKEFLCIFQKQVYKDILTEKFQSDAQYVDAATKSGKADGRIYGAQTDSYIADGGIIATKKGRYIVSMLAEQKYDSKMSLADIKASMQEISWQLYQIYLEGASS